MIDIIITSFNEPKSTLRAVNVFLKSKRKDIRVTVVDPFKEVETFLKKNIKDKRFNFYLDSGEGKSYALNILFQELGSQNKEEIFILTDGDVYVSDNTLENILESFKDKKVGCVTGKPVSLDSKDNKYGFWQHMAFERIDSVRKRYSDEEKFFECSGYLFAIRKGIIYDFPLNTSEDSVIPYLIWQKGYKIKYVQSAEVFVKNPDNWKDWTAQKIRNIKAHENLSKLYPKMPRTKSFINEIKEGALYSLSKIRGIKSLYYISLFFLARLYIYIKSFYEIRKKKAYNDGWRGEATTESTKTLD